MNDEVKKAWNLFLEHVQKSSEVQKLMKAVGNGTATYAEALEYSSLLSKLLVESASEVYPNDSQKVLGMLKNAQYCRNYFKHVDKYLYDLQSSLNKGSGLGMKPVKMIKYNQLLDQSVSSSDDYKADIEKYKSKAELSANKHVDTYQQYNAKTQTKAGYKVTVSRTYDGVGLSDKRACTWCLERAKSNVPYDEAFKNGMFQRHEGCHCIIEYNNNGNKTYQKGKGGIKSWTDLMGRKRDFGIDFQSSKSSIKIHTYESSDYPGIYLQTNTADAKKTLKIINEIVNNQNKYGNVDEIVITKKSILKNGVAAYEREFNRLYIIEELSDTKKFRELVSEDIFPARNIQDVLEHELGGHKAHWDAIKRYSVNKNMKIEEAKLNLEERLRKYVKLQSEQDSMYIEKIISKNAYFSFFQRNYTNPKIDEYMRNNNLNELIADAKVLIKKGALKDPNLKDIIEEILNYDVHG